VNTQRGRADWLADKIERDACAVRIEPCPRCTAPVIRARTPDRVLAVDVTADPLPLDPVGELAALAARRRTWCLVIRRYLPARIRWRDQWHMRTCTHLVVADHRCAPQPPTADALF
jgi:hypothetical protein